MGASFQNTRIETTDRAAVAKTFKDLQAQDAFDNGHSYSGGFAMARGLKFRDDKSFEDENLAIQWLEENAQKWEAALAVRHTVDGKHIAYIVGALCAS